MLNHKLVKKQSDLSCRLKWAHSTIFLTTNTTSSCHRCDHNPITEDFDFHNTHQKVHARLQMLRNEWPELGCEHCRVIEDAGGTSDRLLHDLPSFAPESPVELFEDPNAVHVTPTKLEVYLSNLCQLSCTYCGSHFSSTWEAEDKKFGSMHNYMFNDNYSSPNFQELKFLDKFFDWLDKNGHNLRELNILGGEPFIQPQSDRLINFISDSEDKFKKLKLYFFSNLSMDNATQKIDALANLMAEEKIREALIVGSIDCWGEQAEYIRYGLNTEFFDKNMKYIIDSGIHPTINLCWTVLSTFTMPALIDKFIEWNKLIIKTSSEKNTNGWPMNLSMMQVGGKEWLHPSIFGPSVLDWGFNEALNKLEKLINVDSRDLSSGLMGFKNEALENAVEYFKGIKKSIENCEPNKKAQQDLHKYLTELDRRRGTDYRQLFPIIYEEIHKQ